VHVWAYSRRMTAHLGREGEDAEAGVLAHVRVYRGAGGGVEEEMGLTCAKQMSSITNSPERTSLPSTATTSPVTRLPKGVAFV
jgi:hypothetical protein